MFTVFTSGEEGEEAVLDKWHEIFTFYFIQFSFLRSYINFVFKKCISFSSSPSPAFLKTESTFLFLLWCFPAPQRLSSPPFWMSPRIITPAPTRLVTPGNSGEALTALSQETWVLLSFASIRRYDLGQLNLSEPRFLWKSRLEERFLPGSWSCWWPEQWPSPGQELSKPLPCLLETHLLPYMGSFQLWLGRTHLSHVGAADTDGQQRAFIPPQICSILGLLSAISHLSLAFVI